MGFLSSMNIAASGLTAQRLRLDIATENITNQDTTRTESGGPYRRKMVAFQAIGETKFRKTLHRYMHDTPPTNSAHKLLCTARETDIPHWTQARTEVDIHTPKAGVRVAAIVEDPSDFKPVYRPDHPDADENGYVMMPNVDLVKETADAMAATRAYEANITSLNAIKGMATKALEIGR